jgi:hypothetical protein
MREDISQAAAVTSLVTRRCIQRVEPSWLVRLTVGNAASSGRIIQPTQGAVGVDDAEL